MLACRRSCLETLRFDTRLSRNIGRLLLGGERLAPMSPVGRETDVSFEVVDRPLWAVSYRWAAYCTPVRVPRRCAGPAGCCSQALLGTSVDEGRYPSVPSLTLATYSHLFHRVCPARVVPVSRYPRLFLTSEMASASYCADQGSRRWRLLGRRRWYWHRSQHRSARLPPSHPQDRFPIGPAPGKRWRCGTPGCRPPRRATTGSSV